MDGRNPDMFVVQPRLENWGVTARTMDPYKAPEQGFPCLCGEVYDHPRFGPYYEESLIEVNKIMYHHIL